MLVLLSLLISRLIIRSGLRISHSKVFSSGSISLKLLLKENYHSFIKSWFFGMQQFSFNPARIFLLKDTLKIYKGKKIRKLFKKEFTLRQIRINGNLSESKWCIYQQKFDIFLGCTFPVCRLKCFYSSLV